MTGYDYSLDREAVVEFSKCSAREQRLPLTAFERLAEHPFSAGDCALRDARGRDNQILDLGEFVISFWSDHAARIVRVTVVERV